MSSSKRETRKKLRELNLKNYLGWLSYDIANTFYAFGILTLMASTWILITGQQSGLSYAQSNTLFTISLAISSILMAIMLPILGSLSDVLNERKRFILIFTAISIFTTYIFSIVQNVYLVVLMFGISSITYQWAQMQYDAMLPNVVPPGKEASLSSIAIAAGYLGGGFVIIYATFLADNPPNADLSQGPLTLGYFPNLIGIILVGFILFSIPMIFVKETDWHAISAKTIGDTINVSDNPSIYEVVQSSFGELRDTFVDIFNNNLAMFYYIVAYFIIADFTNLVVVINAAYLRDGLKLAETTVLYTQITTGASIVLFSISIGRIADKFGAKTSFMTVGGLWMVALSIMILIGVPINLGFVRFIVPNELIYVAAAITGPAFSGIWISQRQMVLELVPTEQEVGRYFGLTKFSGKISSSIGPIVWGGLFYFGRNLLKLNLEGSYKFAIMIMGILLALAFVLMYFKVPNNHTEYRRRKEKMIAAMKAQT